MRGARTTLCVLLLTWSASLVAADNSVYLDVTVSLFTHAREADEEGAGTPAVTTTRSETLKAVQQAETRYMPVMLALRLIESDLWGAVRVTPLPDDTAELGITATILHSDHERLALQVRARDSSGQLWLDQVFEARSAGGTSLYQNTLLQDPFQSLYNQIQRELGVTLAGFDDSARQALKDLSLIRYGAALSPETFESFTAVEEGRYTLLRLPAEDDPMLRRVANIRDREYLFIDVVHEQFQRFFSDIKPLYDFWRSSRIEQEARSATYVENRADDDNDFNRGSYYALREQYSRYGSARIEEQYLREMAEGFRNESAPTDMALEETLVNLTGTLEEQYAEWRQVLRELFLLETTGQGTVE